MHISFSHTENLHVSLFETMLAMAGWRRQTTTDVNIWTRNDREVYTYSTRREANEIGLSNDASERGVHGRSE